VFIEVYEYFNVLSLRERAPQVAGDGHHEEVEGEEDDVCLQCPHLIRGELSVPDAVTVDHVNLGGRESYKSVCDVYRVVYERV